MVLLEYLNNINVTILFETLLFCITNYSVKTKQYCNYENTEAHITEVGTYNIIYKRILMYFVKNSKHSVQLFILCL